MRKIFILALIFLVQSGVFAQETNLQEQEINLDVNTGTKQYKINNHKYDNGNQYKYDKDDDEDMPLNFASPVQILQMYKQQQQDMLR